MIVTDAPNVQYAYRRNLNAEDALAFIAELEALDASVAVGYLSGSLQATLGVWVRIGNYRVASDSFIDPSDLMLYVASYYEPDAAGPVEALELNHGTAPEGALHVATVDELLDALVELDWCEEPQGEATAGGAGKPEREDAAEPDQAMADAADRDQGAATEPGREENPPAAPSRLDGMAIVEPSAAGEMHGALVRGWHAMYYEAADGASLLVFD